MPNTVSYIYVARDKYSKIAEKVARVTDRVRKSVQAATPAFSRFNAKMKQTGQKLLKFGSGLKTVGRNLTIFATSIGLLLGASLIKAASDAEETESKFNTVFSSMSVKANAMSDDLAKNFGLAGSQAKKLLGDTGDLLTGFGFTQESAFNLSNEVNELAVDLASFTNFSGGAEGASAALTKALLGERESVKSLGISILEEDVKRKVQILRAKGMTFETERQAKAFATLKIAQEQSKNAIGDFSRTSEQFANQQRILSATVLDVKEKFGKIMLPMALKVVKAAKSMLEVFSNLSPTTKKVILVVAGLVTVLGPLLLAIGGLITVAPLLAAAFAFILGPIGLISVGIVGLIALFFAARNNFMGVGDAIGGTIEQLMINFELLSANVMASLEPVINVFNVVMDTFTSVGDAINGTIDQIMINFDSFTNDITAGLGGFADKINSVKEFFSFGDENDINVNKRFIGDDSESNVNVNKQSESNVNINKRSEDIISGGKSRTDVNVNLRAPEGAVESMKSKTSGKTPGLNLGLNMATAS